MAIHPGTILKEELRERKIKQRELSEQMGMQPSHLSEIVRGKRPMTKTVADKLEAVLGIPSIDWMRLQLAYDYKILDQEAGFSESLNRLRKGAAIL